MRQGGSIMWIIAAFSVAALAVAVVPRGRPSGGACGLLALLATGVVYIARLGVRSCLELALKLLDLQLKTGNLVFILEILLGADTAYLRLEFGDGLLLVGKEIVGTSIIGTVET